MVSFPGGFQDCTDSRPSHFPDSPTGVNSAFFNDELVVITIQKLVTMSTLGRSKGKLHELAIDSAKPESHVLISIFALTLMDCRIRDDFDRMYLSTNDPRQDTEGESREVIFASVADFEYTLTACLSSLVYCSLYHMVYHIYDTVNHSPFHRRQCHSKPSPTQSDASYNPSHPLFQHPSASPTTPSPEF